MLLSVAAVIGGFVLLVWGADRFVHGAAATARNLGFTILTRDRQILDYAAAGHVQALPC